MPKVKIAPSFLTADIGRIEDEVRAVEAAGADVLHLDVMDGHFVPPITFGQLVIAAIRKITSLPLDVHLMIEQPERHIESFAIAGSDTISVHVEACPNVQQVLDQIKSFEKRAGVCVSPQTPLSAIENVLGEADQIIVMGVNPGWGGQKLIPETLPKISRLRAMLAERNVSPDVELDGGVKVSNAAGCIRAGASVLVAGSVVFNDEASVAENMRALRDVIASTQ